MKRSSNLAPPTSRTSALNSGWLKAVGALVASIFLVALVAHPAAASTIAKSPVSADDPYTVGAASTASDGIGGRGVCTTTPEASGSLPVTRWSDGMEFHDRLHGSFPGDIAKNMQRQGIVSLMFGIGNTAWSVTTGMTEMAVNFCVLDKVGGMVDKTAATIADAIMGSGLLAVFAACSIVVFLWRAGRGQGGGINATALFQKGMVLALFGIMAVGAAHSHGAMGGDSPQPYKPGLGSPGWFVTQIDQVVSTSAASLVTNLEAQSIDGADDGPAGRANLGCAPYVKAMKDLYKENYGSGFAADAAATTPLLLSSMWESSALEMWKRAQFGDAAIGTYKGKPYTYGDLMYCRMLESNVAAKRWPVSDVYDSSVSTIMAETGALNNETFGFTVKDSGERKPIEGHTTEAWHTNTDNLAWRYTSSNKVQDRQWVGWAACAAPYVEGSGNDPGANLIHSNDPSDGALRDNCHEFFVGGAGYDGGSGQGEFDWDESDDDISDTGTSDDAEDFLLTLHGNRQAGGMVAGMIYMFSSILVAAVFILFSAAILVAKVAALVMMLGVFGVLALAMLPNSSMSKIGDYAKQYVGLSVFAWGAQLIMSVIALITSILINVGNQIVPGGPGGVMAVSWVGFAPVIAVFCLHFVFKKMKIPSPLKMSGGMAWGQMAAGGALGAAGGMGADALLHRTGDRMKRKVVNQRRKDGKIGGKDRKDRMAPSGGETENPTTTTDGSKTTTTGGKAEIGKHAGQTATERRQYVKDAQKAADAEKAIAEGREVAGDATKRERLAQAMHDPVGEAKHLGDKVVDKARHLGERAGDAKDTAIDALAHRKKELAAAGLNKAKTSTTEAINQFKEKPLQTTKSGLGKTGKAAAWTAGGLAVAASGGTLGLVLGGGALYAGKRVHGRVQASAAERHRVLTDPSTQESVDAYHDLMAERRGGAGAGAPSRSHAAGEEYGWSNDDHSDSYDSGDEHADAASGRAEAAPTSPIAQSNNQRVSVPELWSEKSGANTGFRRPNLDDQEEMDMAEADIARAVRNKVETIANHQR